MNRTRETFTPTDCLKLVTATLNNPSIRHERIDASEVFNATAAVVAGNTGAKILTITVNGVIIQGLAEVLAAVGAWKAVTFDVARGVHGTRAYGRRGPRKAAVVKNAVEARKIEHSISILDDVLNVRRRVA